MVRAVKFLLRGRSPYSISLISRLLYVCHVIVTVFMQQVQMGYYQRVCASIGKNVQLQQGVRLACPEHVFLGDNVTMNTGCWLDGLGDIHIGNDTHLGPMVIVISSNHNFGRTGIPIWKQYATNREVVIESDVWIGAGCIVLPGVRIEHGAVIGAGSVVTHNIPPYAIAMGAPATVRRYREKEGIK